jgi:hypothetical protein
MQPANSLKFHQVPDARNCAALGELAHLASVTDATHTRHDLSATILPSGKTARIEAGYFLVTRRNVNLAGGDQLRVRHFCGKSNGLEARFLARGDEERHNVLMSQVFGNI